MKIPKATLTPLWLLAFLCGGLSHTVAASAQEAHSDQLQPPVANLADASQKLDLRRPPDSYEPMNSRQRWHDYWRQNYYSPGALFQTFFSGLGDSLGSVPPWNEGGAGYAEHFGSEFARFSIAGTIHSSLAAALQQDTRYFPCRSREPWQRTIHALSRPFITYGSQGQRQFDASGLAGIYGAPMLMTTWYPRNYTALGYGVRQGNIALGISAALYVIREFGPDARKTFSLRRLRNERAGPHPLDRPPNSPAQTTPIR
ncbi:MAG TPA: hypothetical protein VGM27_26875 [Acidobacteriaceae bacterium]